MVLVLVAITAFEYAKYMIFPGLTVFYAHIIGIAFGLMIVGATAYRVQNKQEKLLKEKIEETEKRLQSETSFRNVEGNYRKLFFDSMDGVCRTTLDGKIVEANKAFFDIFGGNADGIIGGSIAQFYDDPEDRIKFRHAIEKNRGVKNYELIQKRMDGTRIICSISSSYFYSQKGELEGYLTIVRDITERRRAEQEMVVFAEIGRVIGSTLDIHEVYERFATEARKLIRSDRVSVSLFHPDGKSFTIAYISGFDVAERRPGTVIPMAGSISEIFMQKQSGMIVHVESPEDLVRQFPSMNSLLFILAGVRSLIGVPLLYRNRVIGSLQFRSKTPNAYTEQDLRLAERIGTQIAGAIGNANLFADLQKMENTLRESESRFRALVERAAMGVAEVDMGTGRFYMVNRRLCDMVGRTEEEMMATTFLAITHPEDLHLHEEKTALLAAGKIGHYSLEKRYLRRDGGSVWVNLTISPLWKPGEKPGRSMIVVEDITDRKRAEAALKESEIRYRELSIIDDLTQLYNSRHFYFHLKNELERSNRYEQPLTLLLLDLDNFKHFNDTYGHVEGDEVLWRLGQVVKRCLRETDFAYRYGGEEFTVLLPMTTSVEGFVTAERIRTGFKKEIFSPAPGQDVHVTVSIGIAQYRPPEEMKAFVHRVDQLMYQGKRNGKDRVCCEPSPQEQFEGQSTLPF